MQTSALYYTVFCSRLNGSYARLPSIPGLGSSFTVVIWVKLLDLYGPLFQWIQTPGDCTYIWASRGGIWARGIGRDGLKWGADVVGRYTEDERQQWLNAAISIDDQGNTRISFNGTSKDTDVQPSGVAGNLNLESDMFMGNSPFSGTDSSRYVSHLKQLMVQV